MHTNTQSSNPFSVEWSEEMSGTSFFAYILPITEKDTCLFGVFNEEGMLLARFGSYDEAYFSARNHHLTLMSVH